MATIAKTFDPETDLVPIDSPIKNRDLYYTKISEALQNIAPVTNDTHELRVTDVDFRVPDRSQFGKSALKRARMRGESMSFPVRARYELYDKATGSMIGATNKKVIANIPWINDDGSMLRNGVASAPLNQARLLPNVYHRISADGYPEAQFNAKPRTGSSFRINLDPETGVFHMEDRKRKLPLYHVLKEMGVEDNQIEDSLGRGVLNENQNAKVSTRYHEWLKEASESGAKVRVRNGEKDSEDLQKDTKGNLLAYFGRIQLDPEATASTLGRSHPNVTPQTMLDSVQKLVRIHKGAEDTDDRDSLEFQNIVDMGDVMAGKISADQGNVLKSTLWNLAGKWGGDVSKIPSGLLNTHFDTYFNGSGLVQNVDQVNPYEVMNHVQRVVRMGEGGISSMEAVPREARNVIPSYLGYVDPIRGPESLRIGVDSFIARGVRKSRDGQLYKQFLNLKTGKPEWLGMRTAAKKVIAVEDYDSLPDDKYIPAMVRGKEIGYVPREEVDYQLISGDDMFSNGGDSVPIKSGVKGKRFSMGSKYLSHALPLEKREVPWVQSVGPDGRGFAEYAGEFGGIVKADGDGIVTKVTPDSITVKTRLGDIVHDLHDDFPMARKTRLYNIPQVKVGDSISKGQLLASSNVTDNKGHMAIGQNMVVMMAPYLGRNFEDGAVVSRSVADNLTAHMMYMASHSPTGGAKADKQKYQVLFPGKFDDKQLERIDPTGVVRPGTVLQYGDPIILSHSYERPALSSMGSPHHIDSAHTWEHQSPGIVTAVEPTKDGGWNVAIKSNEAFRDGDKLAMPFGNKGVTAKIVDDEMMPELPDGSRVGAIFNPLGIGSRTNSGQMVAGSLGKVAAKTGKPYILSSFMNKDYAQFAKDELKKHGMSDTEDVYDPVMKKTLPGMYVGNIYVYRLQQTAEAGSHSRGTEGGYTLDETPSRGGHFGSKHVGDMEGHALIAAGAQDVLQSLKQIQGQHNPDFWRDVRGGRIPRMPGESLVREKFRAMIKGGGINYTVDDDGKHKLFAMTNKQLADLTGNREVSTSDTFDSKTLRPIAGGLFDPEATGSEGGADRFAYMKVPEPILNPIMEPVVRSLLGVTKKELNAIVRGDVEVYGKRGGDALKTLLQRLDVDGIANTSRQLIRDGKVSKRDAAIKRLSYASALKREGVDLSEFMFDRIPVVPPKYRPIIEQGDRVMVSDMNYLYKKMDDAKKDYADAQSLDKESQAIARERLSNCFRAIVGVEDPEDEKLQKKKIGGVLDLMLGKNSPKMGYAARKLIGADVDMTGLGVVMPDPDLRLDQIGVPETRLWDIYKNFIIRRLRQTGMPAEAAITSFKKQDDSAKHALHEEIRTRPMLVNRAPTLHRYSIGAYYAVPVSGEALRVSPGSVEPFNMDFDGDKASYMPPASARAVRSALKNLMPVQNLISARNQKPNFVPKQEYLMGMYVLSRPPEEGKKPIRFPDEASAVAAYRSGKIGPSDPVIIG